MSCPVFSPGLTEIVYVPVWFKVCSSMNAFDAQPLAANVVPSGFRIVTYAKQPPTDAVISRLIFCPVEPLQVSRAFCPGVTKFNVTGADPSVVGVIVPLMSPTEYRLIVMLPVKLD